MRSVPVPVLLLAFGIASPAPGGPPCTEEEVKNDSFDLGGTVNACPCFDAGEEAMVILDTPGGGSAVLSKIQVAWQSVIGGQPDTLEAALIVYDMNQTGPASPASFHPLCEEIDGCILPGPVLSDGFLNEFNVLPFGIELPASRFGISLEIGTDQVPGNPFFTPSVVSDDNGHNNHGGVVRNWVKVGGTTWQTSQSLGVSGDWIIRAIVEVCEAVEPCPWDINGNGMVDVSDLLVLLGLWGSDPGAPPDFDGDGVVSVGDLLDLLGHWGPCPLGPG